MALRSPTSAHSYWGSFANPAALPVGNPNLETGDTAFVISANSLYAYDGAAWAPATTTAPAGNPNEVQYNSGGALAGDPNFTYDGTNLTVATGGSAIDIGQGFITGNPGLIVETGAGGTLTLGTAGETVDLVGTNILVNSAAGAAGEVLTSNGPGLAPTWQAGGGGGGTIGGTIAVNEVAFGTGVDTIGGSADLIWTPGAPSVLGVSGRVDLTGPGVAAVALTVTSGKTTMSDSLGDLTVQIDPELAEFLLQTGPTFGTPAVQNSQTPGYLVVQQHADVARTTLEASCGIEPSAVTFTADTGIFTAQIRSYDTLGAPAKLDLVIADLALNGASGGAGDVLTSNGAGLAPTWQAPAAGGINQLTQDVIAGPGAGSQAATVQGMGGATSKIHYVIVGGKYASLQAAVNAAAANDTIFVGPIGAVSPVTSWGDVTFPAQKRLTVIGLSSPRSYAPNIGKVTFAPGAGANILENTIHLENLFINASFAGAQGVNFAGTVPARLRMVNCYIYNLSGVSGNGIVVNNSGAGSSCYLDGTIVQGSGTAGVAVNHIQGYTLIRNGAEISDYQYQIQCAAGTMEVYNSQIQGSLANEVIRITGGTVFLGYSTIRNTTANSTGVNLVNAGAAFGMGNATFAIATGTGYCVNGVAGSFFLYGTVSYSNSAALAYNVKVKNTITALPITQAFTSSP